MSDIAAGEDKAFRIRPRGLDALAAVMLGLAADQLASMVRVQPPVARMRQATPPRRQTAPGLAERRDGGDLLDRYGAHPHGEAQASWGCLRPNREARCARHTPSSFGGSDFEP